MKTSILIAAAVAALVLHKNQGAGEKGRSTLTKAGQLIDEAVPVNGSDFQSDMWARLHGADLTSAAYPNIGGSITADPGPVGLRMLIGGYSQPHSITELTFG